MGKFKQFKTYIRKKLGMTGVAEFVDDAIEANSDANWNKWFSNPKYLKEYDTENRINSYNEIISIFEKFGVFDDVTSLLDAGCGTGQFIVALSKRFSNIKLYGADFSDEGLRVSKKVAPSAEFYKLDLYNLPDNYSKYDVVICNHVLEHVNDVNKTFSEIKRILKPGGWAILLVPINPNVDTWEDPSITDPEERKRNFGQYDHVRQFGRDYTQVLENAGFTVDADRIYYELTEEQRTRMRLARPGEELIYRVIK